MTELITAVHTALTAVVDASRYQDVQVREVAFRSGAQVYMWDRLAEGPVTWDGIPSTSTPAAVVLRVLTDLANR